MWKKIIGPTLLVSLLWFAVESSTFSYSRKLHALNAEMQSSHEILNQGVNEMQAALTRLQSVVLKAVEQIGEDWLPHQIAFEQALENARRECDTDAERLLVETIHREFADYATSVEEWLESGRFATPSSRPSSEKLASQAQTILNHTRDLVETDREQVAQVNERSARLAELISKLRLCFFIGGPAIGIVLGARVARGLQGSIRKLSSKLNDVTLELDGDRPTIAGSPSSELPALENQVHEVSGRVSRVVQELDEARQFSAQSERLAAVGMLAAGVAHELRNPLTSIKLLVQTAALRARNRPLTDRQLQILQDEIARMESSIQSLLDFARIPKPRCVMHDLRDTVARSINFVRPRAEQLGIHIIELLPAAPAPILGDPTQLHLVFANLLLNGLESMEEGGTLCIEMNCEESPANPYRVRICDTGSGIPPELLDRLFEPFVTGKVHGYGLGLTISQRIVHEHGGSITAANRPEGGAVFTVDLPTADRMEHDDSHKQECGHVQTFAHR